MPNEANEKSIAKQGLILCNKMFYLEKTLEDLTNDERQKQRLAKLKLLMEEFFAWCGKPQANVLPASKLGKAIQYALTHQETFEHVLLDGRLELSNNKAERIVKALVMGRKIGYFPKASLELKQVESYSA